MTDFKKKKTADKEIEIFNGDEIKDPLELQKLSLPSDYYSLTWCALKKSQFVGASIYGVDVFLIPSDYFWIYINFISFALLLLLTVILLVKEALMDDVYVEAGWKMTILRVILVAFAQRKLLPEFTCGYVKLLYSLRNRKEFTHPEFANFVALCQMFTASITLLAIVLFVCMADTYIDPVTNFSALCVLSELDDWIGEMIMSHKLKGCETLTKEERDKIFYEKLTDHEHNPDEVHHHDEENDEYDITEINSRITLINKMALITDDDLEVEIDEAVFVNTHWAILELEKIIKIIPWSYVIPLATIPISYALPYLSYVLRTV